MVNSPDRPAGHVRPKTAQQLLQRVRRKKPMPEQIAPIQPADHRKRWRRPLLLLGAGLFLCPIGLCGTFKDYGPGCGGMGSLLLSMLVLALSLVATLVALVILATRRMRSEEH